MSRRHRAEKRAITPDPIYKSTVLAKFINKLMYGGKRTTAQRIVYGALLRASQKAGVGPMELFEQALENARPSLEVKSRRIGGATYQVPVEMSPERRTSVAMSWIITFSRSRPGRTTEEALAQELLDCLNNQGSTIKKKDDTHRMAEANRAFAHYRW
jgi:small subunit ribosomal protein S7